MNTINIRLYNFAKQEFKLSDEKALEYVEIIGETNQDEIKNSGIEYKSAVKEDILKLETGIRKDISLLEISIKKDISQLEITMERSFKEQARWLLGAVLFLVAMILGLYATILSRIPAIPVSNLQTSTPAISRVDTIYINSIKK